jgi:hypothetical protein
MSVIFPTPDTVDSGVARERADSASRAPQPCGVGAVDSLDSLRRAREGADCAPRGVDLNRYCGIAHGGRARLVAQHGHGWRCEGGGRLVSISVDDACRREHGAGFAAVLVTAADPYSWRCQPGRAAAPAAAPVPLGEFGARGAGSYPPLACIRVEPGFISNICAEPVEAHWCTGASCGAQGAGSRWTLRPGLRFPANTTRAIACRAGDGYDGIMCRSH